MVKLLSASEMPRSGTPSWFFGSIPELDKTVPGTTVELRPAAGINAVSPISGGERSHPNNMLYLLYMKATENGPAVCGVFRRESSSA